jgi:hypothetical protein
MEKLDTFEFHKQGRKSFYDWDTMLDGSIYRIDSGELKDPVAKNASKHEIAESLDRFRRTAYAAARVRDLALQTQVDGSSIVIQALPKED